MTVFSVTYWMHCDRAPDSDTSDLLFFKGSIPFVPHVGMRIQVEPWDTEHDSTLHTVERVDWSAARPDHIDVIVDSDAYQLVAYRIREGWRIYTGMEDLENAVMSQPTEATTADLSDVPRMAA